MPYANQATIMGHIGQQPKLRHFGDGMAVASFTIANETRHKKQGEWCAITTWYKVQLFGKQAEWIAEAPKGALVVVMGEIYEDEWTTKDGEQRKTLSINARSAQWVKPKGEHGSASSGAAQGYDAPQVPSAPSDIGDEPPF